MTLRNPTREQLRMAFREIGNRMDQEEMQRNVKTILAMIHKIYARLPDPLFAQIKNQYAAN